MGKKSRKYRKILKSNFIKIVIFLFILWTALYVPIKFQHFSLIRREVKANERFNENLEYINEFKKLKISYQNLYGNEDSLAEIDELIKSIEKNLSNDFTDEIENQILELKSKINDLSAINEIELEEYFNSINDDSINDFNDTEKEKLNNFINEYNNLFQEKKYSLAKEKLDELNNYIDETKKVAYTRKLNSTYEEKSNENPSLREPKYINGILIVNKEYGLPDTFLPGENEEAREAFEKMKADAAQEGIYLNAFSTYRSYWTQNTLYNNYVANYGQDPTDTFSAKPGFSEHQTGLAFDIGGVDRSLWADENFKYTDEGEWLKNNCTKYGFILRYPEGKEWITGYMHESWHFRYIGVEHSKNFENNDLTLEEYLGL
ncbi:M15 family metallopeptidase [Clostridium sp. AL.422]|uniref:M15 family metallopeptidase n=1 Tax=Clostridium TaxID=1485 RepID=UPI00293DC644|nr:MULTISPECIES: M15 family metallopeptidase [unclassified Clostridium]MDV4150649.1 M15 family metallopeptidase [Clostridium sp. AL.422]